MYRVVVTIDGEPKYGTKEFIQQAVSKELGIPEFKVQVEDPFPDHGIPPVEDDKVQDSFPGHGACLP